MKISEIVNYLCEKHNKSYTNIYKMIKAGIIKITNDDIVINKVPFIDVRGIAGSTNVIYASKLFTSHRDSLMIYQNLGVFEHTGFYYKGNFYFGVNRFYFKKDIVPSYSTLEIYQFMDKINENHVLTFGEHKGKAIKDTPKEYLQKWLKMMQLDQCISPYKTFLETYLTPENHGK